MRSVRWGARQPLLAALVAVVTFGGFLLSPAGPLPARAAKPTPAQCQEGLFEAAPPDVAADCQAASQGSLAAAAALPAGFQESVVWSGLTNPTAIRFAADGRVFVAEKSGVIKVFDSLADPTPTSFSDLIPNVHNFWDRGLLGLALDPSLTGGIGTGSYVYVLYAYDHILGTGGGAPKWGDTCSGQPNGPGATTDGCVVSGRLSRFAVSGSTISSGEQVLVEDWCQQYPSHSIGSLVFGPDGALYVSSGDGASFNGVDYGQLGGTTNPVFTAANPCGDPPGTPMSPPSAEGGALRSQDVRTQPAPGGGPTYRDIVLADSPISYFRLGEPSGTTLTDETGSHSGTYVGSPALAQPGALAGDANTAVVLDGTTSEYGRVAGWVTIPTPPVSLEAWVKFDGVHWPTNTSIAGWFHQSGVKAFRFWVTGNGSSTINLRIGFETGNANWNWPSPNTAWHHLVGTYEAGNARLYFDGALVAGPSAVTFAGGASNNPFWIGVGGDQGQTSPSWPGAIDEVAVYNSALSAARVAAHHNAGRTGGAASAPDPTTLDGAILRLDPATGAGMPGNPFAGSPDANARRIVAYGLRNPFRITTRPGTNELWVGDVGWNTWEEINRIPNATDNVAENFGWPCYEGSLHQGGYDAPNLTLCETLYAQGASAISQPIYAYDHAAKVVAGETCPTGSSVISGMTFYPEAGGSFPTAYRGGLFFTDHSRNCIWFIPKGGNGQPDPAARQTFAAGVANPVDLAIGPNGDLFYVDFDAGTIRRITWSGGNQAPTAVIQAVPPSGPAPLTVEFNGSGSSDPEGTQLTYAWDLDGDTQYDDATGVTASWTYQSPGNVTVRLRVTDAQLASGTASQVIGVGNDPPVPVISTPTAALTWKVGDPISFSGSATDAQDGTLPASALSWALVIQHCPSNCHSHTVQTWPGVASGSFNAPDHEYPSYLELRLTATDSFGASATRTVRLDPRTVVLSFQTSPSGLSLAVNAASSTAPFSRTVIVGSSNSVTATSPQTLVGSTYTFSSWSDGLAQSHQIIAPATNTTYTATYASSSFTVVTSADSNIRANQRSTNFGTSTVLRVMSGQSRAYLKFVVSGLTGPASSAKLRLWVTNGSTSGGSCYRLTNTTWTETGITWNNAPAISGSPLSTLGTVTAGTWVEFNVGSVITGNGTYTFAISGGNTNAVDYASKETANDPVLVVTR